MIYYNLSPRVRSPPWIPGARLRPGRATSLPPAYVFVYICIYIYIYIHKHNINTYIYIYIYIHTYKRGYPRRPSPVRERQPPVLPVGLVGGRDAQHGRFFLHQDPACLWVRLDQELISKGRSPSRCGELPRKVDPTDLSAVCIISYHIISYHIIV